MNHATLANQPRSTNHGTKDSAIATWIACGRRRSQPSLLIEPRRLGTVRWHRFVPSDDSVLGGASGGSWLGRRGIVALFCFVESELTKPRDDYGVGGEWVAVAAFEVAGGGGSAAAAG